MILTRTILIQLELGRLPELLPLLEPADFGYEIGDFYAPPRHVQKGPSMIAPNTTEAALPFGEGMAAIDHRDGSIARLAHPAHPHMNFVLGHGRTCGRRP